VISTPDFVTGQPGLLIDHATGEVPGEAYRAYAAWESANHASFTTDGNAPPDAGGTPHFVRDGFRGFVNGIIAPMKLYSEHMALFDSFIGDPATIAALHALAATFGSLYGLDQPGPN
jgi:hypothetical protein